MLQLTFRAQLPSSTLVKLLHDSYTTFRSRAVPGQPDGCVSVTLTDRGPSEGARYRALFEHIGREGGTICVVTEAADAGAAMRSGLSVLFAERGSARLREVPAGGPLSECTFGDVGPY